MGKGIFGDKMEWRPVARNNVAKIEERLMGGVLLVTGGARGIGRATVELAATKGWDVAVGYRSRKDEADAAVAAIEKLGRRAVAVQADMASEADVTTMFEQTQKKLGEISGLVNSAGISTRIRGDEVSAEQLEQLM